MISLRSVLVAMTLFSAGCGPEPAVVTPKQPHDSHVHEREEKRAPAPKVIATNQTPEKSSTMQVAVSPPPSIPPAPTIPQRTCPTLPDVPAESLGPRSGHAIVVTVSDYLSLAPISGVQVNATHHENCTRNEICDRREVCIKGEGHGGCKPTHPHAANVLRMSGKTNGKGRIVFAVPDVDYSIHIPETHKSPGYLTFSSNYDLGSQKCHNLLIEKRSQDGRIVAFDAYLIPETMRAITNEDQAYAAAMQNQELIEWLQSHLNPDMTIRDNIASWRVGFGYNKAFKRLVQVNAFDGSAFILGRWTD